MAGAIVRNSGEGERMWFLGGGTHTWKALSEETDNSMLVFEDDLERGKVTPMHFHADVDEALYVLEGEIVLNVMNGDTEWVVTWCFMLAISVGMAIVAYREERS